MAAAQNAAFGESMHQLQEKVTTLGGFYWQLMGDSGAGWATASWAG